MRQREEVKSNFPFVLLKSLQLTTQLYPPPPPHDILIPTHCLQLFTLSWRDCHTLQPQATLSYELVISLLHLSSLFRSLRLLFLLLTCLPCLLHALPLVYSLGYGLRAQRFGVSPWKLNKDKDIWRNICRLCHIDSLLSHVLICNHDGFCQMLSCCSPLVPPVLFTWVSGRNGVTGHRYEMESINIFADISAHTDHV